MNKHCIYLFILGGIGCSEYSYTNKRQKDVFQQVRRNTVDILLVVDNSCSMIDEQEKLSTNFESFISAFDGVDVDWQIGVVTTDMEVSTAGRLNGGTDEVILESSDRRRYDSVKWERDWAIQRGASLQLSADSYSTTSNTSSANWCSSEATFGDGDFGTPGAPNMNCGDGEVSQESSANTEAVVPNAGDIIFSELMIDPNAVSDPMGEWVELVNLTADPLDISGFIIRDGQRNPETNPENPLPENSTFVLPQGSIVEPYGYFVIGRSDDQSQNGGVEVDVAVGSAMTLNNNVVVLTSDTENVDEIFEEVVMVGRSGSGFEMGLEAAKTALSPNMLAGENAGFLREDANLSLIFVSDEDDISPGSTYDYLRYFTDLKGEEAYRDRSQVIVSAVVGKEVPPYEGAMSCGDPYPADGAQYGPRYIALAVETEGSLLDICEEDFSYIAEELGLTASGLELEFVLSSLPVLESMEVKLYAEDSDDSYIRDLIIDEDFSYILERNAIRFEPSNLPQSETYIVVDYQVLPSGASLETETAEAETEGAE